MSYDVELSDECLEWFDGLREAEQLSVARVIDLLEEHGAALMFPYSSGIEGAKLSSMMIPLSQA